jgi:hypothetical protein
LLLRLQVQKASELNVLVEHIQQVPKRFDMLDSLLKATVAMTTLEVDYGVVGYDVASRDYLEWQKVAAEASKKKVPYLCLLMELCDCKHYLMTDTVRGKLAVIENMTENMLGDSLATVNAELGEVLESTTTSQVAVQFSERHCKAKLVGCFDGFMISLVSGQVTLANKAQLQDKPVEEHFHMLISMSPANSSSPFHDQFNNVKFGVLKSTAIASFDHVRMLKVVQTMIARICDQSVFSPELQHAAAPAISKSVLPHLLEVHVAVHTVAIVAAWAHRDLSLMAKDDRPSLELVEACRVLRQSMRNLESLLASPSVQQLESQKLGLKQNIALFSEWHAGMTVFFLSVNEQIKSRFCQFVIKSASQLQGLLPTWGLFITDEKINETMAKQKVLNNPSKSCINPAVDSLQTGLVDAVEASVLLDLRPAFDEDEECCGAKAVADAASSAAYQCLAVTAALNAIFNLKGKRTQGKVAQSVLDIVAGMLGFSFPKSLVTQLKAVADSPEPVPTIETDNGTESVAGGASKKRRTSVKLESGGQTASSSAGRVSAAGQAQVVLKQEPANG